MQAPTHWTWTEHNKCTQMASATTIAEGSIHPRRLPMGAVELLAGLEPDAESPALACAWHDTLGTTAPAAGRTSLGKRLTMTLDTTPLASVVQRQAARTSLGMRLLWVGLDDDSLALAFALGLSSACNMGVTVSLGLAPCLMLVYSCGETLAADHWTQAQVH